MFYKYGQCPVLIEITQPGYMGFLDIHYVLLTTSESEQDSTVYFNEGRSFFAEKELILPKSYRQQELRGVGYEFGKGSISVNLKGRNIVEEQAFIYRTRFPSNNPISDQVYQLIKAEMELLLGGKQMNWLNANISDIDHEHVAWLISHEMYGS